MFNVKLIITIIAVLAILAGFLGTSPTLSNFFSAVQERFFEATKLEAPIARNVEFTINVDHYPDVTFDSVRLINITINGTMTASLPEGRLNITQAIKLFNYKGSGTVSDNLRLEGSFEWLELPDITAAFGKQQIKLESNFTSVEFKGLALKDLKVQNATGTLAVEGSITRFTGDIEMKEPLGVFIFVNKTLSITGVAQKIIIPSAGINIG